jgi:hypothetical protein
VYLGALEPPDKVSQPASTKPDFDSKPNEEMDSDDPEFLEFMRKLSMCGG